MWKPAFALIAVGALATGMGACAGASSPVDPAAEATLEVAAAFYPLEFVATRIGGEHVSVTGLAPPGVEAHDLELTPSQVANLSQADLVIFLTGFQPAVDGAVAEHASGVRFDVATVVPLLTTPDRYDEDEDHEDEQGRDDDHDHGDGDPHVWLDPQRLATIGDELAAQFGALDPAHRDDYTANAADLRQHLAELDTEYAGGLADCQRREIVVSHSAFSYLADRYDLRQIAITGLTPEAEPSPQRLADVIGQAQRYGATTIFFEVLVSPEVANVIATQVGARTAVLDPIEGLSPGSDDDYFSLMRANLDALRTALDCS